MKFLIVGPSWVGDSVMAQCLYKTLKSKYKNSELDVLSPDWSKDILLRMKEVSNTISSPFLHGELRINERIKLGRDLKTHKYDQAFVLTNSFKSALVPFCANIKKRTGWLGEYRYILLNDIRRLNKKEHPMMVQRFVALASDKGKLPNKLPTPQLVYEQDNLESLAVKHDFKIDVPTIALCPGAEFGPAKRWPSDYYSKVASEYLQKEWQVFLLGSLNDSRVGSEIEDKISHKLRRNLFNLTGKTKLVDVVDLLSFVDIILTNDSGLMHIGASVNTPLVALFGPSSPEFTPPLSKQAIVLRKEKGYIKTRTGSLPGGYHKSLVDLQPAEVIQTLNSINIQSE